MSRSSITKDRVAKRYVLERAQQLRAKQWTRVAQSVLDRLEAAVRREVDLIVKSEPSVGKTIRGIKLALRTQAK